MRTLRFVIGLSLLLTSALSFAGNNSKFVKHCIYSGGWFWAHVETYATRDFIELNQKHCSIQMVGENNDFEVKVTGAGFNWQSTVKVPASELQDYNLIVTEIWGAIGSAGHNTTKREGKDLNFTYTKDHTLCVKNSGAFVVNGAGDNDLLVGQTHCSTSDDTTYQMTIANGNDSPVVRFYRFAGWLLPVTEVSINVTGTSQHFDVELTIDGVRL